MGNFKIGNRVKVVGSIGGCSETTKCKDCFSFIDKILIVTGIKAPNQDDRSIACRVETPDEDGIHPSCKFHILDLQHININWREKINGQTNTESR